MVEVVMVAVTVMVTPLVIWRVAYGLTAWTVHSLETREGGEKGGEW